MDRFCQRCGAAFKVRASRTTMHCSRSCAYTEQRRGLVRELAGLLELHGPMGVIAFAERHSIPEPNTGCWLYEGTLTGSGYSTIVDPSQPFNRASPPRVGVHRMVCEALHGAMPVDILTRHKCDNPPCVNPAHLEPGTHKDNSDDMVRRGRAARMDGSNNSNATLDEDAVRVIRGSFRRGVSGQAAEFAARFGVAESIVRRVAAGTLWVHVQ